MFSYVSYYVYSCEQAACTSAEELSSLSRGGQQMMDRLAALKVPVVAAINGPCLGGGLEVALAW